ncbi:hypothetical protein ACFFJY_14745 [Fictibacillus aquaticus]|uniref:Uncharacterized protein n=1 Tax=Fictibacillus aquaticus TaxID=2021314 RepID=A0A235FDJ0_9BACL|nr:hypothetical protein [Fictibacillus aquaticus]OYD59470.1 hypothetical protein CGZ90_06155 [Fictibacillus aquaticus]
MFKTKKSMYVAAGILSLGLIGAVPALAATNDAAPKQEAKEIKGHFKKKHHRGGHGFGMKMDRAIIEAKAKELGIKTSGKDTAELAQEIWETELKKLAKENNITIDGKSFREVSREIAEAELKKEAKKLGVSTANKDVRQLAEDVMTAKIKKEAKDLNISTDGKDIREVAQQVRKAKITKKAKELGIATANKDTHELAKEVREKQILKAADKLGVSTKNKTLEEIVRELVTKHPDELKKLNLFQGKKDGFFFKMKGFHKHGAPGMAPGGEEGPDAPMSSEMAPADTGL